MGRGDRRGKAWAEMNIPVSDSDSGPGGGSATLYSFDVVNKEGGGDECVEYEVIHVWQEGQFFVCLFF